MKIAISRHDLVGKITRGIAEALRSIDVAPPAGVGALDPADARHLFATEHANKIADDIGEDDVEDMVLGGEG